MPPASSGANVSAQYFAAVDYVDTELLDESKDKKELDLRSQAGFRELAKRATTGRR